MGSKQLKGRLADRAALDTGAANGIGAALARKLTAEGAAVVLSDLDGDEIDAITNDINSSGGRALACARDVTDPLLPDRFVAAALAEVGSIVIIVNNASYARNVMIQNTSDDLWEAMLAVHLPAPFRMQRAAALCMREVFARDSVAGQVHHRKVANVSSGWKQGVVGHSGYASVKARQLGRAGTPEEAAGAIFLLCLPGADYFTRQFLTVNRG